MISAWFNEYGYKIITSKGDSKFIYDLPLYVLDNASYIYSSRWMVLNQMMEIIQSLRETDEDQDITLCTDSRLVEELQGEISPEGHYAKSSLRYFIENDYTTFRRVVIQKHSPTTINERIREEIRPK